MNLDLTKYRIEHISVKELDLDEITQRVLGKLPENFWLMRHIKEPSKNLLLIDIPEKERITIMSYFMLNGEKIRLEQGDILDGNAEYIEHMESVMYGLKDIISDMTDILSGQDLWEECPKCGDNNRFIRSGFCISCNTVISDGESELVNATEVLFKEPVNLTEDEEKKLEKDSE